jgi:hypothetical protein
MWPAEDVAQAHEAAQARVDEAFASIVSDDVELAIVLAVIKFLVEQEVREAVDAWLATYQRVH